MIRTLEADVAVEDLRIGDEVVAFDWHNNVEIARKIVWVGSDIVTIQQGVPDDQAGYPVRVLKDAISEGVPYKDMLITLEHCLFFEGKFVPVRMLVNGSSIFYDHSMTSYTYYHIETEQHSVITADGVRTESYLDTGNRRTFTQHGEVATLLGSQASWEDDAAAPLVVEREFVEPIFRSIEARAAAQGCAPMTQPLRTTAEHDLRLITDKGQSIRKARDVKGYSMFMVPNGVNAVRLVSRTFRPSDTIGPFVDDRRELGVLVGNVTLWEADVNKTITIHTEDAELTGWSAIEDGAGRWTLGDAWLPLGEHRKAGTLAMLGIQILAAGPYVMADEAPVADTAITA